MKKDIDWENLAYSADPSVREELWEHRVGVVASAKFVEDAQAAVLQESLVLIAQGRLLADRYWMLNKLRREEGGAENQGYFGTRVRVVGMSVSFEWFLNRFAPDLSNPGGKKRVLSTHIRKGLGFGYPVHAFRSAKPWELDAIRRDEPEYEMYRRRNAALTKIRRALVEYKKLLARQDKHLSQ